MNNIYVPGTSEQDLSKVIMSLQAVAAAEVTQDINGNVGIHGALNVGGATTTPIIIGGSGTTGTQLTFQTTMGVGTTDTFTWAGGNNGGTTFAQLQGTGFTLNATQFIIAAPTANDANLLFNTVSTGRAGVMAFQSASSTKWQFIKQTDDSFLIYDTANSVSALLINQGAIGAGKFTFGYTTPSTSTTTGALQVAGGVGISGQATVGVIATAAPITKTSAYSLAAGDSSIIFNGAGSITLTLQAASSYPGRWLYVKTIAAFTVISASSNVVPINSATAGTAILAGTAGKWANLQSDGTNWVVMATG